MMTLAKTSNLKQMTLKRIPRNKPGFMVYPTAIRHRVSSQTSTNGWGREVTAQLPLLHPWTAERGAYFTSLCHQRQQSKAISISLCQWPGLVL